MRYRWPSGWTLAAAAFVAAVLGAMLVDHALTTRDAGPSPWEIRPDGFADRTWLYAVLVGGAVAAATGLALLRRPRSEQRTIFANLGSVAVVLGVLYAVVLWFTQHATIRIDERPGWIVVTALLAAAAAGGAITRLTQPEQVRFFATGWRRYFDYAAIAAAVPTAATFFLALVFIAQDPTYHEPVPVSEYEWNEGLWWVAFGTASGAAVLALAGLVARHWLNAVVCLCFNAFLLALIIASGFE